jgi:TRAP-type C4-dicarboxylate transport system substrate-binding protein
MARLACRAAALSCLVWALGVTAPAYADAITLRIATVVPEGSAWARELRAYVRDVDSASDGALRIKIYFGGIAGDEMTVLDRIRRDQLDGAIGSEACTRLAPSMKVGRLVGLFQNRDESAYAMSRLKPTLDREFLDAGFINLGEAGLGPEVLFTRAPVRTLADMQAQHLWIWDLDEMLKAQSPGLGLHTVPLPLEQATRAYDEGSIDGFIAIPTATLAFQWSAQARYLVELRLTFRSGCEFVASRAFDALPVPARQALLSSSAKLAQRMESLGREQDDALLSGLLSKQGLRTLTPSESLRSQFFELAQHVRQSNGERLVPRPLLDKVVSWLADYRAEHPGAR